MTAVLSENSAEAKPFCRAKNQSSTLDLMVETFALRFLFVALAGWVNHRQQEVLEYLIEENRVLKEQGHGRRLRLTDDQRRRLAARGKRLGRQGLGTVRLRVSWHTERMSQQPTRYRGYRFPPEIISHAVWLYHRFSLSFRDVEDLLAERGIDVTYETIRSQAHS